jgi:hypothetical protein
MAVGVLHRRAEELAMTRDGAASPPPMPRCAGLHLAAYDHLTAKIAGLDTLVAEAAAPFEALIARLVTITDIGRQFR